MLQNGNSGQNGKKEQPRGMDYKKRTNLLRKIFCYQHFRKNKKICLSVTVVVVVLVVIVVVPIIVTSYKKDKGGAAADGEEELDSKVLRSEFPGIGMTSVPTTTSYGDGDHSGCALVFINEESKVFNDSKVYCETHNRRLLQEKDLKTVGHCIPKGEDFWAKKGNDDSAPDLCHIYNTEHNFVKMDCTTGRRCICVKDPNTTKKNEET
ncbi:hypothetical protein AB205_0014370 [Aquarana catesbeiana]|uniref:Uncharacterized protein n=1 Tax=Aquarana catesbeiana TaxID=8400 RepID=A0A2G9RGC4_AQUCT|nr:hypothetical protein AB205_0014370 [Aquarana catesbeiana]